MHVRSRPAAALFCLLCTPGFAQTTTRASMDSAAVQGNLVSRFPALSADGRFVAFDSSATNLVTGDTNGNWDVFLRDQPNGMITRVSVDPSGAQVSGDSRAPTLSADGRYIAFYSSSAGLVSGDTNGVSDVFVRDRLTSSNTLVSVGLGGAPANGASTLASISPDGRFVAFLSSASNLVVGDTNNVVDVFVRDLLMGGITRVSVDSAGVQASNASNDPSISRDGRFVAFDSTATNLVPGDTNAANDVFVRDLLNNTTVRASVDSAGNQGNGSCGVPSISADGRWVGFAGFANNLVPGDTNGVLDVFVRDLQGLTTARMSVSSSGAQSNGNSGASSISADGRWISFGSTATNLVLGDTNGVADVFAHDRLSGATIRVSVDTAGLQGNAASSTTNSGEADAISADGRYVAFFSLATNLVPGDTNGVGDILVRDRGDASAFTPLCFGDGSGAACPCANSGASGRGCENSAATGGALLTATGVASLLVDTAQLTSAGELPSVTSVVLQGTLVVSPTFFGDGLRCAGGTLKRLYVKSAVAGTVSAPATGDPSISARSSALGDTIPLGATRCYQVYYRDPNASFCAAPPGGFFNVSNALAVGWGG